jgi:hypothetical protein
VKACKNENKKETWYCCLKVYDPDLDCCAQALATDHVEYWDLGNMDVHGTAFIEEGGRPSSIRVTNNGKYMSCSTIGILITEAKR